MPDEFLPSHPSHGALPGQLLAALPQPGEYFSPAKIVVFLICVLLWAYTSGWVQKDTAKVRLPQGLWTGLVFGGGALGLVLWLLIPLFWIGLLLHAVFFGAAAIIYVVMRNGRVSPAQTVLTIAHLQRLGKGSKATASEERFTKDRIRIKAADGKTPTWPSDPEENAAYAALQDLLFDAVFRRASDLRIDLVPGQPIKIIYRVDGVDRLREPIDEVHGPYMFAQLKKIAGMNVEEHRRPQQGKFKGAIGPGGKSDKAVEIECRASGSTAGERFTLRLVSEESKFRLGEIGLTPKQLEVVQELVRKPKGLVIVCGPKGSGATSTLYAMLREHDAFLQNIHALEIARTQDVENITQHVFDSQGGEVTYGKRLRSILRMEPDVCMVSDLPDVETAQVVAQYAKMGKKMYLGMESKDPFTAIQKFIQAVGDPNAACAGIAAVISQRLVRTLCANCRKGYKPDPQVLKKGNLPTGENRPFYRPPKPEEVEVDRQGNPIPCPVCQGAGYYGRTGVFEVFVVDDEIRGLLTRGTPLTAVRTEARKRGMLNLQETALYKVYEGQTSINEVLRVTKVEQAPTAPARAG